MGRATCTVDDCDRLVNGHGLCSTHYYRWRKTGSAQPDKPVHVHAKHDHCTAGDCPRPVYGHGYCNVHWKRWRKTGDPGADRPVVTRRTTCTVADCSRQHYGQGFCTMHWNRWRRDGETRGAEPEQRVYASEMERFWAKTRELPSGCIEWTYGLNENGYGLFTNGSGSNLAHRWLWEQEHGPLDPKTHLDHYRYPEKGCIGPACIRHVRPTTAQENTLRGATIAAENKAKTHCPKDHPYAGPNLLIEKDGSRRCRTCRNEGQVRRYHLRKAAN